MLVRRETTRDHIGIADVQRKAFGREAEGRIVDRLRQGCLVVVSLVADDDKALVGHILFSRLPIHANGRVINALALAPLAVLPARQRQGIGSMLVRDGLENCRSAGERIVIVLGDPKYYSRFGFSAELTRNLRSPFSGDAFMALELVPGALTGVTGEVRYPAAFRSVGEASI